MTPERTAQLVARWVRLYTRGLPAPIARRRVEEIDADLHDHIAHERAAGTSDRRIALGIASRMVRGVAADTAWRRATASSTPKATTSRIARRSALRVACATACILLVPALAMLVTDGAAWGPVDFVLAGALLVGTGFLFELARAAGDVAYRSAVALALAAALLLVWLVTAVGVIGETGDPADLMYAAVIAVGIAGAVLARFRAEGMALASLAMALVQALVAAVALLAGKHNAPISSIAEILGLNGVFVALFVGSAWLFRRAARQRPSAGP